MVIEKSDKLERVIPEIKVTPPTDVVSSVRSLDGLEYGDNSSLSV
jgi:hypothetical protein